MARGARKGFAFEREICRRLSLWFSGGEADDWFWRSAGSGGRATNRGRKGQSTRGHYGDVAATCAEGEPLIKALTIELKRGYNHVSPFDLVDKRGRCVYDEWIDKARRNAKAAGSASWLIIHKRDQRAPIVLTPDDWEALTFAASRTATFVDRDGSDYWTLPLDLFFAHVLPREVRRMTDARTRTA